MAGASIGSLLTAVLMNTAGKVIAALGLGFVSYQGIDLMLTTFVGWMQGQMGKLPIDALNLLYLSGVPSALNWIFSAYAFTATLKATSHLTAQFKK